MPKPDRVRLALDHIAEALDDLATLTSDADEAAFRGDRLKRRAVERCIEVISEASRRLPDDLKAAYPEIPWRAVAGIGNVLRHDYDEINASLIRQTATVRAVPLSQRCDGRGSHDKARLQGRPPLQRCGKG